MRVKSFSLGLLLLALAACASPREKAYQQAVSDYKHNEAEVIAYAKAQEQQLISTTQYFHTVARRWPRTFQEFGRFVNDTRDPLDLTAFNDLTFATLRDRSVQIHYDINCSRFNSKEHQFTQSGTVNVKPE
jgi:hypothetical protein